MRCRAEPLGHCDREHGALPFVSRGRVLVIDPTWELAWAEGKAGTRTSRSRRPSVPRETTSSACSSLRMYPSAGRSWRGCRASRRSRRTRRASTTSTCRRSRAGVWCSNIAGYCTEEVAEHAIAMVIGLLRGVTELDRDVRAGGWDVFLRPPRRVAGACLGVVGFGRIGRAVARRARALGMEVVAADALVPDEDIRAEGVEPVVLGDLLDRADVVTLYAPLDGTTRKIMDAAAIGRMTRRLPRQLCAR